MQDQIEVKGRAFPILSDTQAIATQSTNPNLDITPLIMPISYSISGAIALASLAAFLRQLFQLGGR